MRGRLVTVRSNVDRRIKIHGTGTEEKYTRHGADRRAFAAVCGAKHYRDAGRCPL